MNQTAAATSRRLVRTIANRQFVRALSTGAQVDWYVFITAESFMVMCARCDS